MPISAGEIAKKVAFVELYDSELTVHYALIDSFTLEEDMALAEAGRRGKGRAVVDGLIDRALAVVIQWDLLDKPEKEGGKPIPLTKEALAKVPGDILTDVLAAIRKDRQPPGE